MNFLIILLGFWGNIALTLHKKLLYFVLWVDI